MKNKPQTTNPDKAIDTIIFVALLLLFSGSYAILRGLYELNAK